MPRGRPTKSAIRQNIVEILYFLGQGYGYEIHKIYNAVFPACTLRSIHYHLKKGLLTKEFKVKEIKKEKGEYSWGGTVEKIYYELGSNAAPRIDEKVKKYLDSKK